MVYNAMKLFMEFNPQLFDECSHDYTEMQNTADQRQQARQNKWNIIAEQAKRAQANSKVPASRSGVVTSPKGLNVGSPMRVDQVDPMTHDSQQRLDALRLQDEAVEQESHDEQDRRYREYERQGSGSGRTQR